MAIDEKLMELLEKQQADFFKRWAEQDRRKQRLIEEVGEEKYYEISRLESKVRHYNHDIAEGIAYFLTDEEQDKVINIISNSEKYKALLSEIRIDIDGKE